MTQVTQFKQGGTSRGAGDDDDDDEQEKHRALSRFQAQVGCLCRDHHAPKVRDFPSRPHERENITACGKT